MNQYCPICVATRRYPLVMPIDDIRVEHTTGGSYITNTYRCSVCGASFIFHTQFKVCEPEAYDEWGFWVAR